MAGWESRFSNARKVGEYVQLVCMIKDAGDGSHRSRVARMLSASFDPEAVGEISVSKGATAAGYYDRFVAGW